MSVEFTDASLAQVRDTIARFQTPSRPPTLLALLAAPLGAIGLLPPRFRQHNTSPIATGNFNVPRHISPELTKNHSYELVEQFFCPDLMSFANPAAGHIALYAYSTILSTPLNDYSVRLLAKLCKSYPIDVLHGIAYPDIGGPAPAGRHSVTWEDCVRNAIAVPAKVANYMGDRGDCPPELEHGQYFNDMSVRTERIILGAHQSHRISSVAYLLVKLTNVGVFPAAPPTSPAQPSFFHVVLPAIRRHIGEGIRNIQPAGPLFFQPAVSTSLESYSYLSAGRSGPITDTLDANPKTRALVTREAKILLNVFGPLRSARIFACYAAGAEKGGRMREGLEAFLERVVARWTDVDHVRHSLLSEQRYLTALLILTVSSFPPLSPAHKLALSAPFIQVISTYISHVDPSIRRCGMLVAEEIARAAGKSLDFGSWDGDDQNRAWCRQLRTLAKEHHRRPPSPPRISVELPPSGYDSDDSLTGYASPDSSRSASPTPSELEEIEKDPTLRVGRRRPRDPPTNGLQSGEEQETANKVEVALDSGYGTELEENTVNLAYAFVGLQDNYDLEDFAQKRQAALNALVACSPRKAAPAIIEQFFTTQYSTDQRFTMLNALVLGAQELAGLPVPEYLGRKALPQEKTLFPSKRLPTGLHNKYVTTGDQLSTHDPVQLLLANATRLAIDKDREAAADSMPALARDRALRIPSSSKKISEISPTTPAAVLRAQLALPAAHPKRTTFTAVAAEHFLGPLVHRFWRFLRNEQTREARTTHQPELHRYRAAGSNLILSAPVLARLLEAVGVLVHLSRHAREWLAVLAPGALELALALGTRPVSRGEGATEVAEDGPAGVKEAAVLTAALELAVVVLDGCIEVDGARSLGLEHTTLLLGTGEWAAKVMESLEDGMKVPGGGGAQEVRLRRAAAGVVIKVDEATTKWRRSMVDLS
ncbi:uncharacterized protein BXZ73DRAFT_86467 [Epithele typhae]|uniref:uncharacterized protein n=1 Tax=Epithele typhae TaxID=378194 RepID=UPI002008A1CF|nr:uncharacterized protein BXZ73DRAFT_86467 [Epithele typhae]KAH9946325.1 hypothetical protein BXZ73DRAFT_86467 [Epithele typhae]